MAGTAASAAEMILQLEVARKLALADAQVYNQVLPGIVPIIGPTAPVEVRRWAADFIAEGFASPALPNAQKEQLTSDLVPTMKNMLENPSEDNGVIRSVVQAASSIYPLVFRRVASHPDQAYLWQDMTSMKLNILKRMDSESTAVRICCIKFIQKVVQVQTPGLIADPRRLEQNETSIAIVPRNHPLLPLPNLEAEASGLLDRLLSVLQENSSDPIMVDATMNCLAVLIRTRPAVANKIISAVLNYNPLKMANAPMTPRIMVIIRSLERTTRALLRFVLRAVPNGPMDQKIQAYLARLQQSRATLFSETQPLKRPAEPTDGLDDAKRQRLTGGPRRYPPLPPPPNSFAHLFTLTEDTTLQQFDVKLLPADLVTPITALLLQHVDSSTLDEAINAIRSRYVHLQKVTQPTPIPDIPMAGPTGIDDEDDYDPEFVRAGDTIVAPATEKALEELGQPGIELGPFELPKPPPLTDIEIVMLSDQTIARVLEVVEDVTVKTPAWQKVGVNRVAGGNFDREGWIATLSRLATRAAAGADDLFDSSDDGDTEVAIKKTEDPDAELLTVGNRIRQALYHYVLRDFRPRLLSVAISWLNEEWYGDRLLQRSGTTTTRLLNYERWTTRLLERLLERVDAADARDKNVLIRFLSEIPAITEQMLDMVKGLVQDPERVPMCLLSLQYLLLMRPPVRELVLNTIESIWIEGDAQAKAASAKVLAKYRPAVLQGFRTESVKQQRKGDDDDDRIKIKMNGLQSPVTASGAENYDPRKRLTGGTAPEGVTAGGGD